MAWALGFGLLLTIPARGAGIIMGPYLQHATTNAMTVMWWTDFTTAGQITRVEYGAGLASIQNATQTNVASFSSQTYRYLQEARITGLSAGQTYNYRVVSSDGGNTYTSSVYTFRTAPTYNSPVHFAHTADGQPNSAANIMRTRSLLAQTEVHGAEFILYSGDMVDVGRAADWHEVMTQIYCEGNGQTGSGVGSRIPFAFVIGNHEIYDDGGYSSMSITGSIARYKAIADNPGNGSADPNWNERYYAFWHGPCYIIALDANNTSDDVHDNSDHLPDASTPDWEPGSEQYDWLVEQLAYAQREAAFTFVSFHYSPYCRGVHGAPWEPQSGYTLRVLDPIFRQYGVDGVMTGHDHLYERSVTGPDGFHTEYPSGMADPLTWQNPSNLNYFVEGNGGNTARGTSAGWQTWMDITANNAEPFYTAFYYSWAGQTEFSSFLDVDIAWNAGSDAWRATFKVIRSDTNGATSTYDEFWFERPNPPDVVYVDAGVSGGAANGTSWADAYANLQTAITAATAGQEIWVKAGTYLPGAARADHFALKLDVGLYGGFTGNETAREARDWAANPTILSGDINGGGLDGGNSAHVIHIDAANAPAGAVLDGFIVKQGYGNDGGGLSLTSAGNVTVRNCVFTENHGSHGGALCNAYTGNNTLIVENCVFYNNTTPNGSGSAIGNNGAGLQFMNCTFGGNAGANDTWDVAAGSVTVVNSILWDADHATASGGGVRETVAGSVSVSHSDVNGGWRGTSGSANINIDPAFVNLGAGNLRLGNTSPAIDIGTSSGAPARDLDGIVRPQGEGIDQGAYERVRLELPAGLTASDGAFADRVAVQWSGVYGATGYEVWRHTTTDSGGASLLGGTTGLSFDDTTPTPLIHYYYWVRATNLTDTSGYAGGDGGYRGVALADDPVALWEFTEGTGSVAADATGHRNHGDLATLVTFQPAGGPTLSGSGVTLDAAVFPGTASVSNVITVADSTSLDFNKAEGSVVMWLRLNNTSGRKTFLKSNPFTSSAGLEIACNGTSLYAYPPGGELAPYALASVLTTAWMHIGVVWEDGVGTRLYVNGALAATAGDFTPYNDTGKWILGRDLDNGREFSGRMAEVAIFQTALAQAEIQDIMANGWPTHTVTLQTSPTGRSVAVDQLARTAPATFTVAEGTHVLSVADPQPGATGERYLFGSWSNGQPQIHALNVTGDLGLSASFTTQVLWTAAANPGGGGSITPASGSWHNLGAGITATASANPGWAFDHWSGDLAGSTPSMPVTMNAPQTVTGNFSVASGYVNVTVTSSPPGLNLVVDGVPTTGNTFSWLEGSDHSVSVATVTQPGGAGEQFVWQNWSDSGAQSHTVTANASGTLTANFQTQYQWTAAAEPVEGGTVVPVSGGWYAAGSTFTATATPTTSYTFDDWTGTLTGASTNLAVTMSAPVSVSANFAYTPTIRYVDADAVSGNNTGVSWANAYTNLQTALGAVTVGEIWVAEGTYFPGTSRTHYFNPAAGVRLYGGFAATEATRAERQDPAQHPTILSGDINGGGLDASNSEHVFYLTSGHDGVTIDGFTITQAWGDYGGGLRMDGSGSLTVSKCIFTANYTPSYHGAAWGNYYHGNNDMLVENCLFYGNISGGAGGAVMVNYGITRVINCTAYGNTGGTYTWYVSDGSVTVENCILWDTGGSGGGIFEKVAGNTTVTFSDVNGGWSGTAGGTGVIAGNPLFVNAGAANFQLQSGSPCIDEANAESAPVDDLTGTARDVTPDMGAYEYGATPTRTLTVASAHATPTPAVGAHDYPHGTVINASVTSPETAGSTRYVCTGWTLNGNAPASGAGTSVSITLTNAATLTWLWKTQHLWTATAAPVEAGTVTPTSGTWYDLGSAFTATATANSGWAFTNWTGTLSGNNASLPVTMTTPVSVTANFDFRGSNFVSDVFGNFTTLGVVVNVPTGYLPSQIERVELFEVRAGGDRRLLDPLQVGTNAYYAASVFDLAPGSTTTFRADFYLTGGQLAARNTFSGQTRAEPGSTPAALVTLHVATNGLDTNPGTLAQPKRTLAGALSATSQAGTHIVLQDGIYYEGPVFPPNVGTTANPLVIKAATGATPILDGSDATLLQSGWTSLGGGYYSRSFAGQSWLLAARNRLTGTVTRAYPMATLAELNGKYAGIAANTFAKYNITAAYYCSGTVLTLYCPEFTPGGNVDIHVSVRDTGVEQDADHNIIYEGVTFRFYEGKGIYVNRSDDVIIRDCRFEYVNTPIGVKRASSRLLVEDSTFLDDCARWGFLPKGAYGNGYSGFIETGAVNVYHPYEGRGMVFRRNTIDGLFDGAHLTPFGATVPAVKSHETDFYENTIVSVLDDLIEVDGTARNVRIFRNTMERYLTGISIAQATEGPTYVLYNVLGRHGDSTAATIDDYVGFPVKSNGGTDYGTTGWALFFHNSGWTAEANTPAFKVQSATWRKLIFANNIWFGTDTGWHVYRDAPLAPVTMTRDMIWHASGPFFHKDYGLPKDYATQADVAASGLSDIYFLTNALVQNPDYLNPASSDYGLNTGSPAIDAGVIIAGVNDENFSGAAPDIGALEYASPAAVVIATAPTGLQVTIDGLNATAPQNLSWSMGLPHTLAVSSPQGNARTQHVFSAWSDGGAQSHTVAAISDTNYTATFTTQVDLTVSASAGGSVNSGAVNGWHNSGSVVANITATPDAGYDFAGWTGDLPAPNANDNPLTLTMSQARNVTATFVLRTYTITASAGSGGTITPVGAISVDHGDDQAFTITPNANHHIVDLLVDGGSVGALATYSFNNVTADHTIAASFSIDDHTLTVVSPHDAPIPAVGAHVHAHGTEINASVTSPETVGSTRYVCTGWTLSGSAPASGAGSSTTFNLTSDATLTWLWKTQHLFTATASPGAAGAVTPASGVWYDQGSAFTATATPNAGWIFDAWSGSLAGSDTDLAVTMNSPIALTATFEAADYQVDIDTIPTGLSVTIDSVPGATPQALNWTHGANHTLAVSSPQGNARTQHVFSAWSDGGAQSHTVAAISDTNYTATFTTQVDLTVSTGAGGSVNSGAVNGWHNSGSTVANITATPDAAYDFAGWTGDLPAPNANDNPLTLTMSQARNVTATFALRSYTITASAGSGGTITPVGAISVDHGNDQAFTITPNANHHIVDLLVDGGSVGALATYSFNNVTADHTIAASFALDDHTLTVVSPHDAPSPAVGAHVHAHGTEINASVTSPETVGSTRYVCTGWTLSGSAPGSGAGSSTTFNLTSDATLTWLWKTQHLFTATASPGAAGSIIPASGVWYDQGSAFTATATPNAGWIFDAWSGSLAGSDTDLAVTMSSPISLTATFEAADYQVDIDTVPTGLSVTIDSVPGSTPQSLNWTHGANHTLAVSSPQGNARTQHVFSAWSDGGAQSHTVAAISDTNYTATFTTQVDLTVSTGAGGSVNSGAVNGWHNSGSTVANITATPDAAYDFSGWTGDLPAPNANDNPLTLTMSQARNVAATFVLEEHTLTVVSPHDAPIPAVGAHVHAHGTEINASVTSPETVGSTRYVCTGWTLSGSAPASGAGSSTTFNLTSDATLTWLWKTQHLFTATASPGAAGSIIPASGVWYDQGSAFTATATPNAGWIFDAWSGSLAGSDTDLAVTMSSSITLTAAFEAADYQVDIDTIPTGLSVTIDSVPGSTPQSLNWTHGANHTLAVSSPQGNARTQHVFSAWSDGGAQSHTVAAISDTNYTATFTTQVDLTVSAGAGGSVNSGAINGWHNSGSVVANITATPDAGYDFAGWTGDLPAPNANDNPLTLTMSQARNVTATFVLRTYTITASAGSGGTITPVGAISVDHGDDQAFTITPNANHHIVDLLVDGGSVGALTTYSFDNVTADHTIAASFALDGPPPDPAQPTIMQFR